MNVLDIINYGAKELKQKKIESFRLDSELLLSKILSKKRENILINLTLHKLEEFLSGEIHEEMNQEMRLKEQSLKLENLNS